jgi:serine/threonine protein phosphatase PrpC
MTASGFSAHTGNATDTGRSRSDNQDYFGFYEHEPYGTLWIICDGMGGAAGGRTASTMAVDAVREVFQEVRKRDPVAMLGAAIEKANSAIYARSRREAHLAGMGTTTAILLIKDGFAHIGHVGDSRIYMIRNGIMTQLTKDHTLVQKMLDENAITPEQAVDHPEGHVISRSIGVDKKVELETRHEPIKVELQDRFVLCSDGLTGMVSDELIREYVHDLEPQTACRKLVDLANENGGTDNITVQVVSIEKESSIARR